MTPKQIYITRNFTLNELIVSSTATHHHISNNPNSEQLDNLRTLCQRVLQPLRTAYGAPIIITSAFRSYELNRLVGGAATSQHLKGQAADITVLTSNYSVPTFVAGCSSSAGSQRHSPPPRENEQQLPTVQPSDNRRIFTLIAETLDFDQLIWEHDGRWIHVSYVSAFCNRHQIFAVTPQGTTLGIAHNWRQYIVKRGGAALNNDC